MYAQFPSVSVGFSMESEISYVLRAAKTEVLPITAHAIIVKLSARVFITDASGSDSRQSETALFRYGNDSENRNPTIKPTTTPIVTAFLFFDLDSAICCFIISTEFRFLSSLSMNWVSDESSGSKFENNDFNLSSSIYCRVSRLITNCADVCDHGRDAALPHPVRLPECLRFL